MVACTAPAWAEGSTYQAGGQVTYGGRLYQALSPTPRTPAPAGTRRRPRHCGGISARARGPPHRPPRHRRRPRRHRPRRHRPRLPPPRRRRPAGPVR
ncbi:carbohydrate-binding protein [Micromonospora taraxaci]